MTAERIIKLNHRRLQKNVARCADKVLIIQDSSTFSYPSHPCTRNLGRVGTNKKPGYGIIAHTSLCLDPSKDKCLGIAEQSYFFHKNNKKTKNRPVEDKESFRWISHLRKSHDLFPNAIHVCDREGDIFEFLLEAQSLKASFIVRQSQNRSLGQTMYGKHEGTIKEKLDETPELGRYTKLIQKEHVELSIKSCHVTLAPPQRPLKQRKEWDYQPVSLNVVQVQGVTKNGTDISWTLLTNLPCHDIDTAREIVDFYAKRWHIELFHKALKTGFELEESCLEDGEKIEKLIALVSVEAADIYALLYAARQETPPPPKTFFDDQEIKALQAIMNTNKDLNLLEIVLFIAREGGFIKTKNYPFPGILTFSRGWKRVRAMLDALILVWNR